MTSRERVVLALNHREPDRVPIDLGGHGATTMNKLVHEKLMRFFDYEDGDAPVMNLLQQFVDVDERIKMRCGSDFRPLWRKGPKHRPDEHFPDGTVRDEWGILYRPAMGGTYYDAVEFPLQRLTLRDLGAYSWPDPKDAGRVEGLGRRAKFLRENTDYAVITDFDGPFFTMAQMLRGFEQFCIDMMTDETFTGKLLDKLLEFWVGYAEEHFGAVGEYVDVVCLGDDFGTERGPWMSVELYRKYFKPRQKELYGFIRSRIRPGAKLLLHSCGSVYRYIPEFIEVGINALTPLQVSARDMETDRLKREFGKDMAFWGGIDTQRVLPRGSAQDVEEEVKKRLRDLAPGGGYVLAQVHNLQPEVPVENIVAMYEAAKRYGTYPINIR
jgi:uroporphyrinogen decarboxylase